VFIPYTEAQDDDFLSGVWWYCYFDIPANGTGSTWNIVAAVPAGAQADVDYIVAVRKNGFNEYEEEGNQGGDYFVQDLDVGTNVPLGFSVFEIYEPGRFYVGLLCYNPDDTTTGCNFTLTANATVAPSTSGVSSTTTTGGSGTSSTHATTTTGGSGTSSTHVSTSTASSSPVSTTASTGGHASSSPAVILVPSIFFALVAVFALLL